MGHLAVLRIAGSSQIPTVLFVRLCAGNLYADILPDRLGQDENGARVGASPIRRRDHSPMLFSSRLLAQALNRRALRINQTTATTMTTLNKAKKSSLDSCISDFLIEYPTSKHAGSPIQSSLGCGVSGNPGVAMLSASKKTACWLVTPSALSGRRIVLKMRRAQPDTAVYL